MAVKGLSEKIEEAQKERAKRYPTWDIRDYMEIIREISMDTWRYCSEVYDSFPDNEDYWMWEIIPRTVVEIFNHGFSVLADKKSTDSNEVLLTFPKLMTIGIEYGQTPDGSKSGTFNPVISLLEDLVYYNDDESLNKLAKKPVDLNEVNQTLEFIVKQTMNTLATKYGITVEDWRDIYRIFDACMRVIRDYLINHKDDQEYGFEFTIAKVITFGIEAWDGDNNKTNYTIQYAANQYIKLERSKDDGGTEKVLN